MKSVPSEAKVRQVHLCASCHFCRCGADAASVPRMCKYITEHLYGCTYTPGHRITVPQYPHADLSSRGSGTYAVPPLKFFGSQSTSELWLAKHLHAGGKAAVRVCITYLYAVHHAHRTSLQNANAGQAFTQQADPALSDRLARISWLFMHYIHALWKASPVSAWKYGTKGPGSLQ